MRNGKMPVWLKQSESGKEQWEMRSKGKAGANHVTLLQSFGAEE